MSFDVERWGKTLLTGFLVSEAPVILKGALNEALSKYSITVDTVIDLVNKNQSLWAMLDPQYYDRVQSVVAKIGDLGWVDSRWAINAIKQNHPALASLFLGWRKARNWLDRQLEEIRSHLNT